MVLSTVLSRNLASLGNADATLALVARSRQVGGPSPGGPRRYPGGYGRAEAAGPAARQDHKDPARASGLRRAAGDRLAASCSRADRPNDGGGNPRCRRRFVEEGEAKGGDQDVHLPRPCQEVAWPRRGADDAPGTVGRDIGRCERRWLARSSASPRGRSDCRSILSCPGASFCWWE